MRENLRAANRLTEWSLIVTKAKQFAQSWDAPAGTAKATPSKKKTKGSAASSGVYTGYSMACYSTHQALNFKGKDGKQYSIWGGSCSNPIVYDADIYIGFADTVSNPSHVYPWEEGYKQVTVINYPICNQLQSGKKIHAGCVGGHGRTGTFLAAVVAQMSGMQDAIQYVRKHYCHKAVETSSQVKFLIKEFGCSKAEETKKFFQPTHNEVFVGGYDPDAPLYPTTNGYQGSSGSNTPHKPASFASAKRSIKPVASEKKIW
jgi:hypothetical protein